MGRKVNLPSVTGLNMEGVPYSTIVFLQAVQDNLNNVDASAVYADQIRVAAPPITIRAKSAQGQALTVSSVNVASGDDYAVLVQDFERLLQSHLQLREVVDALIKQLKGQQ